MSDGEDAIVAALVVSDGEDAIVAALVKFVGASPPSVQVRELGYRWGHSEAFANCCAFASGLKFN